jgi:hypothetical protein
MAAAAPPMPPQSYVSIVSAAASQPPMERLRRAGAAPTRNWSMNDGLGQMQMEARKLSTNMEEAQMVNMMRDFMKLGFTGLEMFNTKVRVLELDGWAESVCNDLHKYDAALAKIYRKYWRRSSATPEMEILMGVGTSLIMHHCKNKFTGKKNEPKATPAESVPFRVPSQRPPSPSESSEESDDEMPPPSNRVINVTVEK